MANNYLEIMKIVNQGNKMGLSNTITRDNGIPLDLSSVQESYEAAVIYAATKAIAYVGQPLAVGDKLYIISDTAAEEKFTATDGAQYDNYLVEVGSKTEGDDVTIDLVDGVLMLHGINLETTTAGMLPQVEVVDGKKQIKWVTISQIVEGDGNKVTTLTSSDQSVKITTTTDTDASLVYDLSVEHPAAPEYTVAVEERADDDTATTYHLTKDNVNAGVAIVVPDAYNDSEVRTAIENITKEETGAIATAIAGVEAKIPTNNNQLTNGAGYQTASDVATALEPYAKTADVNGALALKANQTDLETLEDRVDAFLTGTGATDALDSLQELIEYINTHDDADINGILASIQALETKVDTGDQKVSEYVAAAIDALKIGDYAKAADLTALAGRVEVLEAKPFDTYATKSEVETVDNKFANYTTTNDLTALLADKAEKTDLGNYYTKTEIDNKNYAVEATTLAGYGITDAYTKTEIDNKIGTPGVPAVKDTEGNVTTEAIDGTGIFANAYSKAEVNALLDEVSGGSSETAASVKRQLDEYKTSNNERVAAIETQVGKDVNGEEPATGLFLEVDEAKAQADKGVADAKTANDAIAALTGANGTITKNTADIAALTTRVSNNETAISGHNTKLGTIEGDIASLKAADEGFTTTIAGINTKLGTIEGNITALDTAYKAADAELDGKITTLTGVVNGKAAQSDLTALANKVGEVPVDTTVVDMIKDSEYDDTQVKADIAANTTAIEAIYKAGEGEDVATGLLAEEIERAKRAEQANADAIALLTENPTEAIDSVKELIDYVNDHGATVTGITDRLDGHDTLLAGIGGENQPATVMAAIEAAAYELPVATAEMLGGVKLSDEIGLDTDNKLQVKKVTTDVLVNGVDEFILYGGTSGVTLN